MAAYAAPRDEPAAVHLHALFALRDERCALLEANFSSLVYNLCCYVRDHGDELADEIERGALGARARAALGGDGAAAEIAAPTPPARPDPARAAAVRAALRGGEVGLLRRLWPRLRLLLCSSTGAFEPYWRRLDAGLRAACRSTRRSTARPRASLASTWRRPRQHPSARRGTCSRRAPCSTSSWPSAPKRRAPRFFRPRRWSAATTSLS